MPEEAAGTGILILQRDFPPVTTEAWESAIQKDLKGADYEKKLVWRTEEGIAVRPYYRRENLAGLEAQTQSMPGESPFVRGNGTAWECREHGEFPANAIRADQLHDSGAHAAQELAFALAEGVERLAKAANVEEAARQVEFVYAVGSNYFFEIAKLRAARMLWAQAVAAFGVTDPRACRVRIHVRTSRLNKSVYDRYTNLLRATTEAMSAVIGGADTLYVEPFGFSPRLSQNVQHMLREECHLDAVADPAGGSYYVETLTHSLAVEAWKLFQAVEKEGGYSPALCNGFIDTALKATREARRKAVSSRRRTLVGVNNYPNAAEKTPEIEAPADTASAHASIRLAEPFEQIRRRTVALAAANGRYPKVLLLTRGDLKIRIARANFCFNFLGCAGFEVVEAEEYAGTGADLIVLCSSDPEYTALAREVCPAVKVPVLVAGNPKDQIEALKAAGVHGFVHLGSDAVETLTELQSLLERKEEE